MSRLTRVLRSAAFRLALVYAGLFTVSAGILFATEFWIERKSKLELVFVPCTIKEIAKNPLGLFEECVVLGHQWMLKIVRFSHICLTG